MPTKIIDIHQDIQTYLLTPELLGYPEDYDLPPFNEPSLDRHADLPGYRQAGVLVVFTSIFPYQVRDRKNLTPLDLDEAYELVDQYHKFVATYPDFVIINKKEDFEILEQAGKIGLILHVEGLGPATSAESIKKLNKRGIKSIGLSWNEENVLCSTCASENDLGLKPQGQEVVEAIIDNNIILDLTHASFKTQNMILDRYDYNNIIFSHCGVWDVYPFEQNIRLEVIKELSERGGLIGLTFLDLMINGKMNSTTRDFLKHVDFLKDHEDVAALGTDFFGFKFGRGLKNINRISECDILYQELTKTYNASLADKIFYLNAQRFLKKVL